MRMHNFLWNFTSSVQKITQQIMHVRVCGCSAKNSNFSRRQQEYGSNEIACVCTNKLLARRGSNCSQNAHLCLSVEKIAHLFWVFSADPATVWDVIACALERKPFPVKNVRIGSASNGSMVTSRCLLLLFVHVKSIWSVNTRSALMTCHARRALTSDREYTTKNWQRENKGKEGKVPTSKRP